MKSRPSIILFSVMTVWTVVMSSCAYRGTTAVKDTPVHQLTTEAKYFFLEAINQQAKGDLAAGYDLFAIAKELDPEASEPYFRLSTYMLTIGEDSLARESLEKAISINPKNDTYHELMAQIHIKDAEYDKAIDSYENLLANNRSRTDALEILLQLYEHQKDYKQMMHTIERIEQIEGTSEDFTLAKMQVYQMEGSKDKAYKALCQLVEEHPNDVNYKVMLGNWLQKNSREEEALEIFLNAQKDDPTNENVDLSLYDHYRADGQDSIACVYRDRILMNKYTSIQTKRTMIQQVIADNDANGGDSTLVTDLFDRMIENDPQNVQIMYYRLAYYHMKEMPEEEFIKAYEQILKIEPDDASSRIQLILLLWKKADWNAIIDLCLPAIEYNTDEMTFCYFLGLAYYNQDNDQKALEAFQQGVSRINDKSDASIVTNFYALMGDILHNMGKDAEAFEAYDNCLKWDADNISCLNNYAYYISITDGDLKKAEQMSKKTIDKEPQNATYLDTYAWILYLQERFIEAQSYIDKALENMDKSRDNSAIYEHAGDIYKACNETPKAVEYWKKALEWSGNVGELNRKIKKYEK